MTKCKSPIKDDTQDVEHFKQIAYSILYVLHENSVRNSNASQRANFK
jgi:hypothetical protein